MADAQMGPLNIRFIDRRRGRTQDGAALAEANNLTTLAAAKTRLKVLKPSSYTDARLATMTSNDIVYALRLESADSAGI